MSLSAPERETIIRFSDENDTAYISTHQRTWVTKLKKNRAAKLIGEGNFDGTVWAEFEVPKRLISVRSKIVTRELTDEQKAQRIAQLQKNRER